MLDEAVERAPPELDDPESPSLLPALAEVHRRAGRPDEAEQVARRALEFEPEQSEARVVLALALLDQGRVAELPAALEPVARALLERHGLERGDPPGPAPAGAEAPEALSEAEIERAFASAEAERERMLDADEVAERAIRQADRELADELAPAFATRTVADLLEGQGARESARRIRAQLETRSPPPARMGDEAILAELERWLENLRRRS